MPFHAIYTDSCKKHVRNVTCLLPIPRLLAVGSFVSLTEAELAFQHLPGPFLVFILRSVLQHCLRPGVFTYPVFVVSAAVGRAVFVTLRLIINLQNPRGYFTYHQVY